ncbi:DUF6233 domain-containing protein [Streptomyces sp. NPDC057963]|uniref:DUF6233 domain-containing protein n=1 Tax=Streptomyces sp. NPDC057963 TaxID=3346290 RepID=UPI0036EADD68
MDREQALALLADGIRACAHGRPDTDLGPASRLPGGREAGGGTVHLLADLSPEWGTSMTGA